MVFGKDDLSLLENLKIEKYNGAERFWSAFLIESGIS